MPTNEPISVIVPHFNDLDHLETCLASLENQTMPRARYEIIVADNNSPCGIDAVTARVRGRARVVLCCEKGAGPARNAGIAIAAHPILAFTDSDCVAEPQWLEAGVGALDRADIIGGQVKVSVREPGRRNASEAFETVFAFDNRRYIERLSFTGSGNLFTRKTVFDAVGGFRATVSEDMEWSHRAVAAGFTLAYEDRAAIAHPARETWPDLRRKWHRVQRESFALLREKRWGRLRWLARSLALPASILAHFPRAATSSKLDNRGERLRAAAMLVRIRLWRFADAQRLTFGGD